MANDPELFPAVSNRDEESTEEVTEVHDETEDEHTASADFKFPDPLPPNVLAEAKLSPFDPTPEVDKAVTDFGERLREAIAVSPADWPKGRILEIEADFAVVPISLKAKFGQE